MNRQKKETEKGFLAKKCIQASNDFTADTGT